MNLQAKNKIILIFVCILFLSALILFAFMLLQVCSFSEKSLAQHAISLTKAEKASVSMSSFLASISTDPPTYLGLPATSWSETVYDDDGNRISNTLHYAGHLFCGIVTREYTQDGKTAKESYWEHSGEEKWHEEYEYDAAGRIIRMQGTGIDSLREWQYDERGNEIFYKAVGMNQGERISTYDADGILVRLVVNNSMGQWISSFAADGSWAISEHFNPNGERDSWEKRLYERDSKGRVLSKMEYILQEDGTVTLLGTTVYAYDEWGNEIFDAKYDAQGELTYKIEYLYDKEGHLLLDSYYAEGFQSRTEWLRNENGEVLLYTENDDDEINIYAYMYEYDDAGRVTKKSTIQNGELSEWITYAYDAQRNKISTIYYQADGTAYSAYLCEYDEQARLIRSFNYTRPTPGE